MGNEATAATSLARSGRQEHRLPNSRQKRRAVLEHSKGLGHHLLRLQQYEGKTRGTWQEHVCKEKNNAWLLKNATDYQGVCSLTLIRRQEGSYLCSSSSSSPLSKRTSPSHYSHFNLMPQSDLQAEADICAFSIFPQLAFTCHWRTERGCHGDRRRLLLATSRVFCL